jgi:catechol 2,3-dioxygenase-like lactoylglutathione lyase family enzyme
MTQSEFALAGGYLMRRGITRLAALVGIAGTLTGLALYSFGSIGSDTLAYYLVGFGIGPVPFLVGQWLQGSRAVIIVGPDGIHYRSIFPSLVFAWKHIVSVGQGVTGPDTRLQRWLAGGERRYVEVKLSHSPRTPIWGNQRRTDAFGIPGLAGKVHRFHLRDPDGFLRAAERFLGQPSVAAR